MRSGGAAVDRPAGVVPRPVGMLYADAGARDLAMLRLVVFGTWCVHLVVWPITNAANVPSELVVPVGVLRLVPLVELAASDEALLALQLAAILGCVLCMLGTVGYRWIGAATVALLVVHEGLVRALGGYVNHGRLLLLLLALVVVVSPSADAWTVRRDRVALDDGRYAWPLLGAATLVASTYSLVAARRLVQGGVEIFTGRSMELWLVSRSTQTSALGYDVGGTLLELPGTLALLPLAFLGTTLVELVGPLVVRWDRLRVPWLVAVVSFHVGVTVTMNLDFRLHAVLVVLLFGALPWLVGQRERPEPVVAPTPAVPTGGGDG